MAVWTIGLWLAFLAGTFAISDHAWTSAIAAIPLATAMTVCALLGTSHGWHRTLCGITFAVLLIIWMAWRLELMEWERWFCALVVVTLAAGLAVGGSALASPHRLILRDTYNPPLSPYDYTSPLSSMRSITGADTMEMVVFMTIGQEDLRVNLKFRYIGSRWMCVFADLG